DGLPDRNSDEALQRSRPYVREVEQGLYTAYWHRREQVVLAGHTSWVQSAAFSPDGSRIVTASADGTARVWHADGRPLATLTGHSAQVANASFSPDGSLIVTASWDKTARLWTADGKPIATLAGHGRELVGAVFSPDGSKVLTMSFDATAR